MASILSIENLRVSFRMDDSRDLAVRDVSAELPEGTTLGLVGESGCGKSVTAFSILRPDNAPGVHRRRANSLQGEGPPVSGQ